MNGKERRRNIQKSTIFFTKIMFFYISVLFVSIIKVTLKPSWLPNVIGNNNKIRRHKE